MKQGYILVANNMDFSKVSMYQKLFPQCYLHAHIFQRQQHYIPSFLGLQFEQYTRVSKIAKATRDMNKNMDTVDVLITSHKCLHFTTSSLVWVFLPSNEDCIL